MLSSANTYEIFIGLMLIVVVVVLLARRLRIPVPIALVLGGIAVAFVPNLPRITLDPELIFIIVLPPLLVEAAYNISIRDFLANLRPVILMAVGLVTVTSGAVAGVMMWLFPHLPLAAGFALGAIVSPPDAVAATAITRRLRIPRRVSVILEGESLINDASALTIYKFALIAVVTGVFSLQQAFVDFLWMAVGGIAIGLVIGIGFTRVFRYIHHIPTEVTSTFLVAYTSYIAAEMVHASGVLATVVTGLVLSWRSSETFSPEFRIRASGAWEVLTFILNGVVFVLIGLQFPTVFDNLSEYSWAQLMLYGLIVSTVVIVVRLAWVFVVAHVTRWLIPAIRRRDPTPPARVLFLLGWTGFRGVISLAAAMALPLTAQDETPFPGRDMIVFLSFAVIFVTLVGQGLTLPWIIRRLHLAPEFRQMEEEWQARKNLTEKVLARLEEIRTCDGLPQHIYQRVLSHYQDRLELLGDGPNTPLDDEYYSGPLIQTIAAAEQKIWSDIIAIEREALNGLRRARQVGDEVVRSIESEIDLLHARFIRS